MNYTDLPRITLEQVQHSFEHGKKCRAGACGEAKQLIREAIAQAQRF